MDGYEGLADGRLPPAVKDFQDIVQDMWLKLYDKAQFVNLFYSTTDRLELGLTIPVANGLSFENTSHDVKSPGYLALVHLP